MNARLLDGGAPLAIAAQNGDAEVVVELIKHKADTRSGRRQPSMFVYGALAPNR